MDAYVEAQIATVKELIKEAKEIGDVLGEHSLTSRLEELKKQRHNNETWHDRKRRN